MERNTVIKKQKPVGGDKIDPCLVGLNSETSKGFKTKSYDLHKGETK